MRISSWFSFAPIFRSTPSEQETAALRADLQCCGSPDRLLECITALEEAEENTWKTSFAVLGGIFATSAAADSLASVQRSFSEQIPSMQRPEPPTRTAVVFVGVVASLLSASLLVLGFLHTKKSLDEELFRHYGQKFQLTENAKNLISRYSSFKRETRDDLRSRLEREEQAARERVIALQKKVGELDDEVKRLRTDMNQRLPLPALSSQPSTQNDALR